MKYALIAGACSGLAQVVIDAIEDDFVIFAMDINPAVSELYKGHVNIHPFILDVTATTQIEEVRSEIEKQTRSLDLLINFAGVVELGSVVEVKPEQFEKSLQINIIGNYKLNYMFFPYLKAAKGRIIIVSSEYGKLLGLPFHSFYTTSKHALEMYADSLRREVAKFGIKIIKIRPGSFKTEMVANIEKQFGRLVEDTILFHEPLHKMKNLMKGELKNAINPNRIVKVFKKAIYRKKPKIVYSVHNSFKMKLLNILPSSFQDWILRKFF